MRAIATTLTLTSLALGQTVFTGPAASATAPSASQCPAGKATSSLAVSGLSGTISKITVKLNNISVAATSRIGAVNFQLEGPGGQKLLIWRAIGSNTSSLLTPINITLDDSAASLLPTFSSPNPQPVTNTSYKPTAYGLRTLVIPPDELVANACLNPPVYVAAAPLGTATLGSVFNGFSPNGTWRLHVIHNGGNIVGAVSITGWELAVTTLSAAPTATVVTSSANPSLTGGAVTLTATVTNAGAPVGQGNVTFRNGSTVLAAGVPLNASGQATTNTNFLVEGLQSITATFEGTGSFALSTGTLAQEVNNATSFANGKYCNTGTLLLPSSASAIARAAVYPSKVFLSNLSGAVSNVKLHLNGFTHQRPLSVNLMLVSPDGRKFVPLSNVGGTSAAGPIDLVLSDSAASFVSPSAIAAGTFQPTAINLYGNVSFPEPAPPPPYQFAPSFGAATFTSAFQGTAPSGAWQLFALTQGAGTGGQLQGGWCIEPTLNADAPTTVTVNGTPNPVFLATKGGLLLGPSSQPLTTITAHVERQSDGAPALSGSVTFTQGLTVLGTAAVNASGDASIGYRFATQGDHVVIATYSGVAGLYAPSSGSYTQIAMPPTTSVFNSLIGVGEYCNELGLQIIQPASIADTASPYPARILVPADMGVIKRVTMGILSLTHAVPNELDMLLVGPAGQNLVFFSGAGGSTAMSGMTFLLDDSAPSSLPQLTALAPKTAYRPTSYNSSAAFLSPAPPGPYVHAQPGNGSFSPLYGFDGGGMWRLFVADRVVGNLGSLGGWCLNFESHPDLTVSKSHTGNFFQGQTGAEYRIVVRNVTRGMTSGVVTVTENVPSGMTLVSLAGNGWTCPAGGNTCTRSDVLPGLSSYPEIVARVNVSVTAPAQVTNFALVSGGGEVTTNNNAAADPTTIDPTVEVTIQTSPSGLSYSVDGVTYNAARTFRFIVGSPHTIATTSPQPAGPGTRYSFQSWSDGGPLSHTIHPMAASTITVNFETQHELTTTASVGGTISPVTGYYRAGGVTVTATPDANYQFAGFTGALTGSANNQPLLLQGPASVHARFDPILVPVTIRTQPAGRAYLVDGTSYTSEQTFQFHQGSQHTIAVASPQAGGVGERFVFTGWSDGITASRTFTALIPMTITAGFQTEFQLSTSASAGGSIAPASGFYPAGTLLSVAATAQEGFAFTGFSGALTGMSNPQPLTLSAPASVTASFVATVPVTIASHPAGRLITVDGQVYTAPRTFQFLPGTRHWVATQSSQGGSPGVRYIFVNWSNGGAISQPITATSAVTLTAQFKTEYQLTTTASKGGIISPASGYYPAGDVTVTATPQAGFLFSGFTDALTGTTNPQTLNLQGPARVSAVFTLQTIAPAVTQHPSSQTVAVGAAVTFAAAASGVPAPAVQWEVSSDGGASFQPVPGAISPSLSFVAQAADHDKRFRAVFTNSAGGATTSPALLTLAVSGRAALSALISGKTGLATERVWTLTVTNQGPGTALSPRLSALSLTQTAGTPCRPVVLTPFPVAGPALAPGGAAPLQVSLNFGACAATARFTVNANISANNGADSATLTLHNQLR